MKNRNYIVRLILGSTLMIASCLTLAACGSPTGPTPPAVPGVPQGLDITTDGDGNSTLSWSSVSEADSYKVYHSSDGIAAYSEVSSTTGISYLLPYYGWYKVSAVNEAGEGVKSAGVERVPPGGNPKADSPRFLNESDDAEIVPGSYDEALSIKISLETGGDAIYFTTDGTVPEVGNPAYLYGSPINVTAGQTVTITAIASGATGYSNSDAAVGTFHVRTWEVVGGAGFSGGEVWYVSLDLNDSGLPIVAFTDASTTPAYRAMVMGYDGSEWSTLGGSAISADAATEIHISVDSDSATYVAYKDESVSGKATVRRFSGSGWTTLGTAGFSSGTFIHASLAVYDSGGNQIPYVSYKDSANSDKATVQYYDGSWKTVGTAGFTPAGVLGTSLALRASDGIPWLAYIDASQANKATVQRYEAGSWSLAGPAGLSTGTSEYLSLALDSSGTPYLAFRDGSLSGKATVMKYEGGAWSTVGSAGFSAGTAGYVTLAISSTGEPYVAYADGSQSGKATLMRYHEGAWQELGSSGFSPGTSDYLKLVLDAECNAYVAFKDGNASGRVTVMAWR
ncbi:MAG TPA: chitobiase/beta-hexosaminidase C-terminal domain-containing protein [Spirochaetales bacterium]|nr:chitobiase/beta-hexosaminidase C-terminal domain-containing protein [Spirochaetales bacterium]